MTGELRLGPCLVKRINGLGIIEIRILLGGVIHGVPKGLHVGRAGRAFVNRFAGESVDHFKCKQFEVKHKLIWLEGDETKFDDIIGKCVASRERPEEASERISGVLRFGIAEQSGYIHDVCIVYCRDPLRAEGRIDTDGTNYCADRIKSCSGDVENGSDPVEAKVLLHNEGANERSATD